MGGHARPRETCLHETRNQRETPYFFYYRVKGTKIRVPVHVRVTHGERVAASVVDPDKVAAFFAIFGRVTERENVGGLRNVDRYPFVRMRFVRWMREDGETSAARVRRVETQPRRFVELLYQIRKSVAQRGPVVVAIPTEVGCLAE